MPTTKPTEQRLQEAVCALEPKATALFAQLREATKDAIGITRASYGDGEEAAACLLGRYAAELGLTTSYDSARNLWLELPGTAPTCRGVMTGSHLDSVPSGGNYDGAAGVIAGILALEALLEADLRPAENLVVLGMRGEESAWFGVHHIGSRALLGLLPAAELDTAKRFDTGRSLADHMTDVGCDVDSLRRGWRACAAHEVRAFVELHIEQGPVLVDRDLPVGIVQGIRGNARIRSGYCIGEYAHSGAVPRSMRRDAVLAIADLVARCEAHWEELEAQGRDLVLTFGKLYTDPTLHTHNKVPGRVDFVLDARSHEAEVLDDIAAFITAAAEQIGAARGVEIAWDAISRTRPAAMDPDIQAIMQAVAGTNEIPVMSIASGGGHDAGDFANAGVPTGMIFVRNPHGSHNPDEAMAIPDFIAGTKVLAGTLARLADAR